MEKYLLNIHMLDFENPNIQQLIEIRNWRKQDDFKQMQTDRWDVSGNLN